MSLGVALSRIALAWSIAFALVNAYWSIAEAAQPGQQYADQLWPCAYLAYVLTVPVAAWTLSRWAVG